ncbi:nuclease-related domain-containing protein [Alkalihalobacillus sp. AL-G]|uniref:nuclease-related domain-containing protein n=1 Tax=Alkalihalobacillus sp. AL-G TaxID=2926399 RepID=UPI00272DA12A|nr:nuclease-related domain-containing protein [Alkalihalobacillus sp. AL-G]WLD95023.1 NERD domain-containing protein [Alkalihalobacillus sp. AL-G]
MLFKQRVESDELKLVRFLKSRMQLSKDHMNYYRKLEKGFEGEAAFDAHLGQKLKMECLILNDLLYEYNNTFFQIDNLLIAKDRLYFNDVKNHEGDYIIEKGRWYTLDKKERKDPLLQLDRGESLFRSLLQELGVNLPIEGHVIFVNPEFHLYQAPLNQSIIFPTQINRFIHKLNQTPSNLRTYHTKLAEKLVSLHVKKNPFTRVPEYSYDQLKKGITCPNCQSFVDLRDRFIVCNKCGCTENVTKAVTRSVNEYTLLFPEKKITTNAVHEWCHIIESKSTIKRVLQQHFNVISKGRSSYYVRTGE